MKDFRGLAERQWGSVARAQLGELGYQRHLVDGMVERGALAVVHRGSYRVPGAPQSRRQDLMAACLASGGVASHRSAAELWGLAGIRADRPELLVPGTALPRRP